MAKKVTFEQIMEAVDYMMEHPYYVGDGELAVDDMEFNGKIISFGRSPQLHQAIVEEIETGRSYLVHFDDNCKMAIHVGNDVFTPREYFIREITK